MRRYTFLLCSLLLLGLFTGAATAQSGNAQTQAGDDQNAGVFKTVAIESKDGSPIAADLYMAHQSKDTPFIVLCHQATWSRGEYREIAPKLNQLGFNCLAIDQRSGGAINGIVNETARLAKAAGKPVQFVDAEQDIVSALDFAKKNYAKGKVILWGSSYSSALAIRIAGEHPDKMDAVLAFAPGEYFGKQGKSKKWIQRSAKKIKDPVFITSAKDEYANWRSIAAVIPKQLIQTYRPSTKGNHGSRALWGQYRDSGGYWAATVDFLEKVNELK